MNLKVNYSSNEFKPIYQNTLILGKKKSSSRALRTRDNPCNKKYRSLFLINKNLGVPGKVLSIHYDPYRSSNIVLVLMRNNLCGYFLNIAGCQLGDSIMNSNGHSNLSLNKIKPGSSFPNYFIPTGSIINQVWSSMVSGPVFCRSSGSSAILVRKNEKYSFVRLNHSRLRKVSLYSFSTLGKINDQGRFLKTKAGENRWLGKRPIVRGVAKNPIDHGHGGGEGKKSKSRDPKTFWGKKLTWRKTSKSKLRNSF